MKYICYAFLILGGIPLLIYPFVFLADVAALAGHLAGHGSRSASSSLVITVLSYQVGSLLYPIVYFLCLKRTRRMLREQDGMQPITFSFAPLVYLGVLCWLFYRWFKLAG